MMGEVGGSAAVTPRSLGFKLTAFRARFAPGEPVGL